MQNLRSLDDNMLIAEYQRWRIAGSLGAFTKEELKRAEAVQAEFNQRMSPHSKVAVNSHSSGGSRM